MIDKQLLIDNTVKAIKINNGQLVYDDIKKALTGETGATAEVIATFYQMMAVICHNIPYYENSVRKMRGLNECFKDAITFYNANQAESEIVHKSNSDTFIDSTTGFTLPKLTFGDETHSIFKSGSGGKEPDLVDINNIKYEVKRNFSSGSRSSLHNADYLIDCLNTTIEVRKINTDNTVDTIHPPLARFNGFLSNKVINPVHNLDEETMQLIKSGELITEIEKQLTDSRFNWNS